ncbi:MAG: hypothetical protein ACN2B6_00950 [Rickettsiales bacterium]
MTTMLWEGAQDFQGFLDAVGNKPCEITIKPVEGDKLRTLQQNKAYWKGCAIAAQRLKEAGWTRNAMFKIRKVELDYDKDSFAEDITKPFMSLAYKKQSSKDLTTTEMSEMWQKIRDQIILSTTNSDSGPTVDMGPFPSLI